MKLWSGIGGTVVFGEGEPNQVLVTMHDGVYSSRFLACYGQDGTLRWVKHGERSMVSTVKALSDGSFVTTGDFRGPSSDGTGPAVFGKGEANETTLNASAQDDSYIAKYTSEGSLVFAKAFGSCGYVKAIAETADGSICMTGPFDGTLVFDRGSCNETILIPETDSVVVWNDFFVAKYDRSGKFVWARQASSKYREYGTGIGASEDGGVLAAGVFGYGGGGDLVFGKGEPNETLLAYPGRKGLFMAKFKGSRLDQPPVASLLADPLAGTAPLDVTLSYSGSDPDGVVAGYRLDFGDGSPLLESAAPGAVIHTYGKAGSYTARLTVTDNDGLAAVATAALVVSDPVLRPVAEAWSEPSPAVITAGGSIALFGRETAGVPVAAYEWDFDGDGAFDWVSATSGNPPARTYALAGSVIAVFRVTATSGLTATATVPITVNASPSPPTLVINSVMPASGNIPLDVVFKATGTSPVGGTLTYYWDFDGDGRHDLTMTGASGAQVQTNWRYTIAGKYAVKVRAVDLRGMAAEATAVVTATQGTALRIWISTPKDSASIGGSAVSLRANVAPGNLAARARFQYYDGAWHDIGGWILPPPYSFSTTWDVSSLADGPYLLRATAEDTNGVVVWSEIGVVVNNAAADCIESVVDGVHRKRQAGVRTKTVVSASYDGTEFIVPCEATSVDPQTDLQLTGTSARAANGAAAGKVNIGAGRVVDIPGAAAPGKTVFLRIPYPDADGDGCVDGTTVREGTLRAYWFDTADGTWKRALSSEVDTTGKRVTAQLARVGEVALFGDRGNAAPQVSSASPESPARLYAGSSGLFTVECWDPDGDALTYSWTIDGLASGVATNWMNYSPTAADIGDHVIVATVSDGKGGTCAKTWQVIVSVMTYTITASAGPGGAIAPGGAVMVELGAAQTFNIIPSVGYKIAGVLVDGAPVGEVPSYTLSNVTANHTISATFSANPSVTVAATLDAVEGSATGKFALSRTGSTSAALAVNYTLAGTAASGVDYIALTGRTTIPAGAVAVQVSIVPRQDTLVEGRETVTLSLAPGDYQIGGAGEAVINLWDDEQARVSVSAYDGYMAEPGTDTGKFRFLRRGSTATALTVKYALSGTATNGVDYAAVSGTAIIPAGSTYVDVVITPINDATVEGEESVVATVLEDAAYQVYVPASARIRLMDNEVPIARVSAVDNCASEPGANTGAFRIIRTGATTKELAVKYTMSGTATNGMDYALLSGTAVIPVGKTYVDVVLKPLDDATVEDQETAVLTIAADAAYQVGTAPSATVRLLDDEKPIVNVTVTDPMAAEPAKSGVYTITRSGRLDVAVTVGYAMSGTAVKGVDYVAPSGTVTFLAGETVKTVELRPIDDTLLESKESAYLKLTVNGTYQVGVSSSVCVYIYDDDRPELRLTATTVAASEAGPIAGVFTVTATPAPRANLVFNYTLGGTAMNGTDYQALPSAVTIPAGQTTATIIVNPVDDAVYEGKETVTVTPVADAAYRLYSTSAVTVTIADND